MKMIALLVLVCLSLPAFAADGLIAVASTRGAKETMDRLESAAKERNLVVFARIDHAAGAAKIGKTLRPTEEAYWAKVNESSPLEKQLSGLKQRRDTLMDGLNKARTALTEFNQEYQEPSL